MLQPEKKSFADTIKKKPETKEPAAVAAAPVSVGTQTYAEADRKRGGRPPKAQSEKLGKNRVVLYLSDEDMQLFKDISKKLGMPVATFVKATTLEKIKMLEKQ